MPIIKIYEFPKRNLMVLIYLGMTLLKMLRDTVKVMCCVRLGQQSSTKLTKVFKVSFYFKSRTVILSLTCL